MENSFHFGFSFCMPNPNDYEEKLRAHRLHCYRKWAKTRETHSSDDKCVNRFGY